MIRFFLFVVMAVSISLATFTPRQSTVRVIATDTSLATTLPTYPVLGESDVLLTVRGPGGVFISFGPAGCRARRIAADSAMHSLPVLSGVPTLFHRVRSPACFAAIAMDTTLVDTVWATVGTWTP